MMFIIFDKTNKTILSNGSGNPTESENKLYLGDTVICNDLSICGWKYIADQRLETDENGAYLHDADYYDTIEPVPSLQEQISTLAYLMGV